jgi:hypothetical protein
MGRTGRAAFAGLVALALGVSAIGPCHCLGNDGACHREDQEADAHACCEKPAGVKAVADDCCEDAPELALASTDVPEVAPPALRGDHGRAVTAPEIERALLVDVAYAPPPHPRDRTTVLLI